ncbi:hypothetical protein J2P12_00080 [Candidatus Bathyarchaeota archaeon]|nr:hypothetical protein [Candidatus Bathyarchaeota archaeon]
MPDEKEKPVYMGDSKASSAEQERILNSGGIEITSTDELMEFARMAEKRHAEFTQSIQQHMNQERAQRIRHLRCQDDLSWRELAEVTYREWGTDADWYPINNQLAGVALCEVAAQLLGEDVHKYPWVAEQ